jgi:hypothetical protein
MLGFADQVGGEWGAKARTAALAIEGAESECENASPTSPIRLLADCQTIFEDAGATELSAREIIAGLCALDETPSADYRSGRPTTERGFAALLRPFGNHIATPEI